MNISASSALTSGGAGWATTVSADGLPAQAVKESERPRATLQPECAWWSASKDFERTVARAAAARVAAVADDTNGGVPRLGRPQRGGVLVRDGGGLRDLRSEGFDSGAAPTAYGRQ